jgi:hypothetical protein
VSGDTTIDLLTEFDDEVHDAQSEWNEARIP